MEQVVKDIKPLNIVVDGHQDEINFPDKSRSLILQQRKFIESHSSFEKTLFDFKTYIQHTHELHDHLALGKKDPHPEESLVSSQIVSKSSQRSTILPIEKQNPKNIGVTTYFFLNKPENEKNFTHHVYCDPMYNNCLVIPLKHMVTENDHPLIYLKSQQTYHDKDQDYKPNAKKTKPLKQYVFELMNIFDLHADSNSEMRETIVKFFTTELVGIEKTIGKLVKNETTKVLLIVHRNRILSNDGIIDDKSIKGAIMFGGHCKHGFTVDYLAVSKDNRYLSIGTLLINFAQVYSSLLIKNQNNGKQFKKVYKTFLACRKDEVGQYYQSLGFEEVQEMEKFELNQDYSTLGQRFDYHEWKDSSDPNEILTLYWTTNLVSRYINRIKPGSYIIEDSLYNEGSVDGENQEIVFPKEIDKVLLFSTNNYISGFKCQPIKQSDIDSMIKTDMTSGDYFQYAINKFDGIPLGEIYNKSLSQYFKHFELDGKVTAEDSISQLFTKFLLPCEIFFYPPANMGIKGTYDHKPPCWITLNCKHCKKKCLVKKENGLECYEDYLLKVLMGIWASHIFCYEPNNESKEWNKANRDWFTCNKRVYLWFSELKTAQHSDSVFFDQAQKPDGYMYVKSSLKKLIKIIVDKYDSYLVAITSYLVDLKIQCLETMKKDLETLTVSDDSNSSQEERERDEQLKLAQTILQQKIKQFEEESMLIEKTNSDDEVIDSKVSSTSDNKKMTDPDKDDQSINSDTPLSQVNKKNHKKDHTVTDDLLNTEKKRRRWRDQGKDQMDTVEFEEDNRIIKDPDLKVSRLAKIKENTPVEEKRSIVDKQWNQLVQQDYEIQKNASGIEYVDVKKCTNLNIVSQEYISKFNSMSKEEKINLLEIEHYDSDTDRSKLDNQDHFLLHLKKGNPVVIHKNWFEIEQDDLKNTDTRRIKVTTEKKCYKGPNKVHKLANDEKKAIKKAHNMMNTISQIQKIKRLPDDRKNVQYFETKFEKTIIRTSVKYIGIDQNNISCPLEDQWLKDNFNTPKLADFWDNLVNMKADQIIDVPTGSSDNSVLNIKIPDRDKGPPIKYIQIDGTDCLTCSLASGLNLIDADYISQRLLQFSKEVYQKKQHFNMKNILDVMTNKVRSKGKRRTRMTVTKMKPKSTFAILHDKDLKNIYHCVLYNHHAIVMYGKWIVDPLFPFCIKRSEKYLRMSAEMELHEDTDLCISLAYKYQKIQQK